MLGYFLWDIEVSPEDRFDCITLSEGKTPISHNHNTYEYHIRDTNNINISTRFCGLIFPPGLNWRQSALSFCLVEIFYFYFIIIQHFSL